jgi:hypothetical protein
LPSIPTPGVKEALETRMTEPVTKSVFVRCPAKRLFDFLANAENWPRYAVHNVLAIRPGHDGYWVVDTPRGPGRLRIMADERTGVLDHEFIDAREGRWIVPARAVAVGGNSLFMLTLTKPDQVPAEAFDVGMKMLDDELRTLKSLLEGADQ